MTTEARGVVVSYDGERGFGFVRAPGFDGDVFVHASAVVGGGPLRPGQRVRFVAEGTDRGPRAVRVHPGAAGLPPAIASAATLLGAVVLAALGLRAAGLPWAASWLGPINLATLAAWAWDKHRAVRDGRRVPESALLALAALGGSIGAILGVAALRHKRRKPRFLVALGAILALQVGALAVLLARP